MSRGDLLQLRPEGIYCPAGDFYLDPWRPVARAVLTHGHADHSRTGHGQYYLAETGLGIARHRLGEQNFSPYPFAQSFAIGAVQVSFHSAGHILGSAQVRVEHQGEVWVLSGDYKRAADPTCAAFEVVPCDVFISEATFALPIYRWPDTQQVMAEILSWWQECAAQGVTAVLACYALGKAQRILAELAAMSDTAVSGGSVYLHGAMVPLVQIYRAAGIALLPTEAVSEQSKQHDFAGALVLAPPSALGTPWMQRFQKVSTGFASGWMQVRGQRRRQNHDRGFVLSDHADWPGLLASIQGSGAKRVLITHGQSDALVRLLNERGIAAEALRTELGGEDV